MLTAPHCTPSAAAGGHVDEAEVEAVHEGVVAVEEAEAEAADALALRDDLDGGDEAERDGLPAGLGAGGGGDRQEGGEDGDGKCESAHGLLLRGWGSAQRFLEGRSYRGRVGLALGFAHDRPERNASSFFSPARYRATSAAWAARTRATATSTAARSSTFSSPSSASRAAGSPGRSTRLASSAFAPAPVVRPDSASDDEPAEIGRRGGTGTPRGASPARPRSSFRSQRAAGPGGAPAATAASNQAAVAASAERRSAWSAERPGVAASRAWSAASAGSAARSSARTSPRPFRGAAVVEGSRAGRAGRRGAAAAAPGRPGVLERHGAVPDRGAGPGVDRVDEEVALPEELPVRPGSGVAERRLDPGARAPRRASPG